MAGLDHEAESVDATRANAAANAVAVDARQADILVECPPSAPVVTANLLAPLLVGLAARMAGHPRHLIAGGLTHDQADEVVAAFARHHGLVERERRHESGWTALHLGAADARPAPPARPLS